MSARLYKAAAHCTATKLCAYNATTAAVGQCRLTVSKTVLKAPLVSALEIEM